MERVLIVEDAVFFGSLIEKKLRGDMNLDPVWVTTLQEADEALLDNDDFVLALLDLTLPDAKDADIVNLVAKHEIPMLVFSSTYERSIRDQVMQLGVIDYIIKESPASLNYLYAAVSRVLLNRSRTVLVVDDSRPIQKMLSDVLKRFQLNVLIAENGAEALEIFEKDKEISLVITDYQMPVMDGLEFTKALQRHTLERRFSIIGLSAVTDTDVRIQFIKSGAADFLNKPFEIEELFCRVSQNLNFLDQLEMLQKQANNDFLTGLYNRRYFFETGHTKLAQAHRSGEQCAVMLLDIDNFKAVNDTYGHDAGDRVLIEVASRMSAGTRSADLLSRFGGEEFCKLLINADTDSLNFISSNVLNLVGKNTFDTGDGEIPVTVSIGVAYGSGESLNAMIEAADALLYQAKRTGRNRAVISPVTPTPGFQPHVVEGPPDIEKPYVGKTSNNLQELWR